MNALLDAVRLDLHPRRQKLAPGQSALVERFDRVADVSTAARVLELKSVQVQLRRQVTKYLEERGANASWIGTPLFGTETSLLRILESIATK